MSLAKKTKHLAFSAVAAVDQIARAGSRAPLADTTNFLLLQYPTALGTAVHATPLVAALRAAAPGCKIAVAASGIALDVFANNPNVDWLVETPSPLKDLGGAVRSWRQQNPFGPERYVALTTLGNERTRIGLAGLLCGASARVGFTEVPELYRAVFCFDRSRSLIDNNLDLARLFGSTPGKLEPRVYFSAQESAIANALLREANPQNKPLVAIVTQASGGQRTGWHTERFVEVIRAVTARGFAVVYPGTAADEPAIQAIRNAAGGCGVSIAGRTSVCVLAATLAVCDSVISLDTGTMHVGRAVGVPMVVLGPSWQRPMEWMPLGLPNVRILRGEDIDEIPERYQLDEIEADSVVAAFDDLLANYPPSAEARAERVERSLSQIDHLAHNRQR